MNLNNIEHWAAIYFIITGMFNSLIAFSKVMGWSKLADECQKVENAIAAAVQAWVNRQQPPQGGNNVKATVILAVLILTCGIAKADDINIIDNLKKIPAMKQGIAYSVADQKWNYITTITVAEWKGIALEAGYAGRAENTGDKIVGVISYDLFNAKKAGITWPVADLIDLRLGVYGGIGRAQIGDVPTMRGNNETDYGVSATAISLKF